ncbi:MAG: hypothetical protein Q8M15_05940 [Bacteroidota bacterium]|nr:hypothetical protein [Bacteroidota bacterium]
MMYLSICITLLTLLAAMYFLTKVNNQNLGSFFKWITYIVIAVALLILICQLARGIGRMACHRGECKTECKMEGMGHHKMMMKEMHCEGEEMECCDEMEGKMHKHKGMMDKKGEMRDSTSLDD